MGILSGLKSLLRISDHRGETVKESALTTALF
jgi:hypothetical protein